MIEYVGQMISDDRFTCCVSLLEVYLKYLPIPSFPDYISPGTLNAALYTHIPFRFVLLNVLVVLPLHEID